MRTTFPHFFIIFVVMYALSSCSLSNEKIKPLEIIDSIDCTTPCWRGITPGVTTFDEAWKLAQRMLETTNSLENVPTGIERGATDDNIIIYFDKISITFYANSLGVIDEGKFYFHLISRLEKPTMADLLSIYGEPDSIEICHELMEMRRAMVYIYYPQMYFLFDQTLPIDGDSFEVIIGKNTHIDYIYL